MNQANLYVKANDLQRSDATYVLENYGRLIKWRKDGEDVVLDVGCGTGDVTVNILLSAMPRTPSKIIATDVSNAMIEYASEKFNRPYLEFHQLDIATHELRPEYEEAFDHVFSFYCLHWVRNQQRALMNMKTMLKPGGDMLLTFLVHHPIFSIYENMQKMARWSKYMQDLEDYISPFQHSEDAEKEYSTLLSKVGFNVHLCKVVPKTYTYPGLNVVRKAMQAVNPFLKRIPEELRSEYVEDYIEEVRKMKIIQINGNNNEEKVQCPYLLLVVFCSKP